MDQAKLQEALDRCRAINRLDGVQVFFKMIENPEFCTDLTAFATNWTPKEKGIDDVPQEPARAN